jgi:NADH-quinone oxidoreductase subunit N
MIRNADGEEDTETSHWAGLGRRSPAIATAMALFLLALAGIPLTSGFISKFAIFQVAATSGGQVLVVIGVLSSAIAAFAYARVIVTMFFREPNPQTPQTRQPARATAVAVAITAAATMVLGVAPQPLFDLAGAAGQLLR